MTLHVLNHHDGVIHHDADGENETEQRQVVERKPERRHGGKGADEGDRHRKQRDDGSAPGLQKHNHHQHHQKDGTDQGFDNRTNGFLDEKRGVVHNTVIETLGKTLFEFFHGGAHCLGSLQRIGAGQLEYHQRGGGLAAHITVHGIIARSKLNARDVAQICDLSLISGFDNDVAELLFGPQPAQSIDRELKLASIRHRRLIDDACRHLHVLFPDGIDDISCGEVTLRHFAGVKPDSHAVVARAEYQHVAHAADARQHILNLQIGVVPHVELIVGVVRREQMHHHSEFG